MIQAELGRELEDYVESLVLKGRYPSGDLALQSAVRLIREREEALAKFDAAIEAGLADVAAGRVYSVEEVRERLRARTEADLSQRE